MKHMSKKGFTLIEMLLAIAITLIISGVFLSLMISISSSYYRTYNDVDCADIAAMYAEALENQVLYDVQNHVEDDIYIDASTGYLKGGSINFDSITDFNHASTGRKWDIRMLCTYDKNTGEFRYTFFFIDMYVNVNYLHYVYSGSFWIPTYAEFVPHTAGEGDQFMPGEVNGWDYNYHTPSRNFNITFDNEGVDNGDDLTGVTSNMTSGGYHVLTQTNGVGRLEAQGPDEVSVPVESTIIHIDPVPVSPS